ncbi:MAG TPA: histidine phosphatase family protein, partial [Clostridia bacterium]|nr:histidine phosphatase family protein [Clostridia bacterium]
MNRIYLVRHGEAQKPDGRAYCLGRTDWPLSAEGKAQAAGLSMWFHGLDAACYTSPLARCRETAFFALGREAPVDPRLGEMNLGAWDGLP